MHLKMWQFVFLPSRSLAMPWMFGAYLGAHTIGDSKSPKQKLDLHRFHQTVGVCWP